MRRRGGSGLLEPHGRRGEIGLRDGGAEAGLLHVVAGSVQGAVQGHASIETTERYLGVEQDLQDAPCDRLGLRLRAAQP